MTVNDWLLTSLPAQESRWRKLLSSMKRGGGREGGGPGHSESFSLKHSHNCANNSLRAGVSNMMGYKKSNQANPPQPEYFLN